jgi:FAD synthetase
MSLCLPSILTSGSLGEKIRDSSKIISTAIGQFSNRLGVCVSGGKDAGVMMDLALRVHSTQKYTFPLFFYYIQLPDTFPEVKAAVAKFSAFWRIEIKEIQTDSLKSGLTTLIHDHGLQAVMLGVRSTDPTAASNPIVPTSPGWPKAMRVLPILNWSFHDIWQYTDVLKLPVCELYEKGFTSIGSPSETFPNPLLKSKHARELTDVDAERAGRIT